MLYEFDLYFQFLWLLVSSLFLYYKNYMLYYPSSQYELEFMGIFLLFSLNQFRIYSGSKGNKTETSSVTVLAILLTIPCLIGNIYFLFL